MKLKYYGTRGSLPVPGQDTVKYGGNTSCIKITVGDTLIILDGGSGLRVLGNELLQGEFGSGRGTAHIFFSHAHWDHINGFPFFTPAYIKGNRFVLYGEHNCSLSLRQILSIQQSHVNFPVRLEDMSSSLEFVELSAGEKIQCSDALISCFAINHSVDTFSYCIEAKPSSKIVYVSDYEHLNSLDMKLVEFTKNANLLVYDSMFTSKEYAGKKGWGHSTYQEGIKIAVAANAKQLHLFHYNPEHSDRFIDKMEKDAQDMFPNTYAAREGWEIEI